MKKMLAIAAALLMAVALHSQEVKDVSFVYTEASDLTLIGKIIDTPNPYHRVDTVKYKGFTKGENTQVRCSSGIAVAFRTNSRIITVSTEYGFQDFAINTMPLAYRGYDLYYKDGCDWVWAGAAAPKFKADQSAPVVVARYMDGSMKEFIMYLPIYSEEYSVKIGTEEGSVIEAIAPPFRHRVAIFGSSYTHGISCSRAGMTYPAQFTRHTGIQLLSLGCSGNCKMQPYFADVLADVEADAFIFDAFSNPGAKMIGERLFPFIERLQDAHPGVPLIFQQTIYRESRNVNARTDSTEQAKIDMAEKMMKEACRKYKDVYFVHPNASAAHESSVDGTHPDDYGYYLWARSIEKPVLRILRKYGIK